MESEESVVTHATKVKIATAIAATIVMDFVIFRLVTG